MTKGRLRKQYIELLKKTVINEIYLENEVKMFHVLSQMVNKQPLQFAELVDPYLIDRGLWDAYRTVKEYGRTITINDGQSKRIEDSLKYRNIVEFAHSMIGRKRIDNLHHCIETVLAENIPGDLIETGVWRGGSTIFMRGVLFAHEVSDRRVWVADSFEGLAKPVHREDTLDLSAELFPVLAVSLETVKALFARYDLLDDRVVFLKGFFKDTLRKAPIDRLAVLRLDGDYYDSTMDALVPLYDKVSPGGFVIIDDYDALDACAKAVNDFRNTRGITAELIPIDEMAVYWRKPVT